MLSKIFKLGFFSVIYYQKKSRLTFLLQITQLWSKWPHQVHAVEKRYIFCLYVWEEERVCVCERKREREREKERMCERAFFSLDTPRSKCEYFQSHYRHHWLVGEIVMNEPRRDWAQNCNDHGASTRWFLSQRCALVNTILVMLSFFIHNKCLEEIELPLHFTCAQWLMQNHLIK